MVTLVFFFAPKILYLMALKSTTCYKIEEVLYEKVL